MTKDVKQERDRRQHREEEKRAGRLCSSSLADAEAVQLSAIAKQALGSRPDLGDAETAKARIARSSSSDARGALRGASMRPEAGAERFGSATCV